ncbi:MAG: hypothetical protein Q9161_006465 [Pseudevernia consocians]
MAPEVPAGVEKYLNPSLKDHGNDGHETLEENEVDSGTGRPVQVGFPKIWEKSYQSFADIWAVSGYPLNPDLNSGNPLGLSICPNTAYRGIRITSSSLLLKAPSNLHILTNTNVARVLFSPADPLKAIGIETLEGAKLFARAEVILSAGALNTPKILFLSGIGPASELEKPSIPVRLNLPAATTGFFKSTAIYQSEEFNAPPEERRRHPVPTHRAPLRNPPQRREPGATALPQHGAATGDGVHLRAELNGEDAGTVTLSSGGSGGPRRSVTRRSLLEARSGGAWRLKRRVETMAVIDGRGVPTGYAGNAARAEEQEGARKTSWRIGVRGRGRRGICAARCVWGGGKGRRGEGGCGSGVSGCRDGGAAGGGFECEADSAECAYAGDGVFDWG